MNDKNDKEEVDKKLEKQSEEEIKKYWTKERRKNAKPIPMRRNPEKDDAITKKDCND